MTVWYHQYTFFVRRFLSYFAIVIAIVVAFSTTLLFATSAQAETGVNQTINFQGRLSSKNGGSVPDGYYNIQFKIYQDGQGTTVGNPGGILKWTESYTNKNNNQGVLVRNSLFSVNLGSSTPFGSSVDWNQSALWLSLNVAGSAANCTSFGTAPCGADGEMLPMKRITASPYALNAGAVNGKTADNFIQLAQGVQTDATSNTTSIFLNKTGTGNLVQLQSKGEDLFTINNHGDVILGETSRYFGIADASTDQDGGTLLVGSGNARTDSSKNGGSLLLQAGSAGQNGGNGGNIVLQAGSSSNGANGSVYIGANTTASIQIGSTELTTGAQTVLIGANGNGGTTNVVIGSGAGADAGTTQVQAKNSVSIATNGVDRATFNNSNTVYFGNGVSSSTPNNFTLQGTDSTASSVAGGSLTVQGGNAKAGSANGGNVTISGGAGNGSGVSGLVVLTTPTFSTITNDSSCYPSGALATIHCTLALSTVNNASAAIIGFNSADLTANIPDPTITTAGRILYIMAAPNTQRFYISMNAGATTQLIKPNTAATLLWNGSDWVNTASSSSTTLQDTFNNSQAVGGNELTVANANGLTVAQATGVQNAKIFEVKDAGTRNLLSVNNAVVDTTEYIADGGVHDGTNFSAHWASVGTAAPAERITTDGYTGGDSVKVTAGTAAYNGVGNILANAPSKNKTYNVSLRAKLVSGSAFNDIELSYSPDGGATYASCMNYSTRAVVTNIWTEITCTVTTSATNPSFGVFIVTQPTAAASARTFLIDDLSFKAATTLGTLSNIQVGGTAADPTKTTLFTLDKSTSAPQGATDAALLGSMYYDTTLGKVQCYEATGWGNCGTPPDTFVSLSPEFSNAVVRGTATGTMSTDFCSDKLNINDGSSSQATVCGVNEMFNFYKWTTTSATAQTKSIVVTYQLPNNFNSFVPESTSFMSRVSDANASVVMSIQDDVSNRCSINSTVQGANAAQALWKKTIATGANDPASCALKAGDTIVFKIDMRAVSNASAYVSNLNFAYTTKE